MEEQKRQAYLEVMGITSWAPKEPLMTEVLASSLEEVERSEPEEAAPSDLPIVPVQKKSVTADKPTASSPLQSSLPEPEVGTRPKPESESVAEPRAATSEAPWLDEAPPCLEELSPIAEFDDEMDLPEDPADDVSTLDWEPLQQRVTHCERCELHKTRTQSVFGVGHQSADLFVIGEAPGAEEDKQGEPFVGRAGGLLNAMLLAVGLKREQVFIANILKCRPPGNRDPRPDEAAQCQHYLKRQIELVQPKAILAVGRIAAQNLLASQEPLGKLRGKQHRYNNIPMIVTYHPAYLLRSPDQKGKSWKDLQQAIHLIS